MAVLTLGTNATTSLANALKFLPGANSMIAADVATVANAIRSQNANQTRQNGDFTTSGLVRLPGGRGIIQMQPGDYIGVDSTTGWPIVVSAYAIASGPWTHS